jgi:hypothetical protein
VIAARRAATTPALGTGEQQVGERSPGLERPGVLQLLQLQHQRSIQPEGGPVQEGYRGASTWGRISVATDAIA